MKKLHIILLVLIAGAIAALISFLRVSATYESIAGAKSNPGKFVHVAAQLDKASPIEYDERRDPNYFSFTALDSAGDKMKVVYRDGRIPNLEISDRIVLEGRYKENYFECKRVQTKCPSKYKEEPKVAGQTAQPETRSQVQDYSTSEK
jgi:cytochrome c-type biogenesis protein CcmE